jgi:predicted AAA+ superfamily ATPase
MYLPNVIINGEYNHHKSLFLQKNQESMYSRYLQERIVKRINSGKAIVVMGPRQVGKTTLIEAIL